MHGSPRTCCGTLRGSSRTSSSRSWTAAPSGDPVSAKTSGRRSRTNCCPVWGRSQGARTIDGIVLKQFISSLRVAETVWMEGVFLKDYPPEAYTIKCLEVNIICHHQWFITLRTMIPRTITLRIHWLFLQPRVGNNALKNISSHGWRKSRQILTQKIFHEYLFSTCQELLFESEQLRRETDDLGPQVFAKGFVFFTIHQFTNQCLF